MVVQLGLPEGRNLRLQEAVTWAFTGWSWSNATASLAEVSEVERRDDFPAPGSLFSLMPSVPPEQSLDRDSSLFSRFDRLLSDACFRGAVTLTARRAGTTQFEEIPSGYFFKPRGFSYFHGTKIDDTPAHASFEEIIGSQRDGEWEDAFVDRDQFVDWLTRFAGEITRHTTLPVSTEAPAALAIYRTGTAGRPTSMHLVLAEAQQRLRAGAKCDRLLDFARQLSLWLGTAHRDGPQLKPESIRDNPDFKSLVRQFQAKSAKPVNQAD